MNATNVNSYSFVWNGNADKQWQQELSRNKRPKGFRMCLIGNSHSREMKTIMQKKTKGLQREDSHWLVARYPKNVYWYAEKQQLDNNKCSHFVIAVNQ